MIQIDEQNGEKKILDYVRAHGVINKDKQNAFPEKKKGTSCRKHIIRVILDLHGMNTGEAIRKIKTVVTHSKTKGIKELLIIHGRGLHSKPDDGPVLKMTVRKMLEEELGHLIKNYRTASPCDGGDGATLVYLS